MTNDNNAPSFKCKANLIGNTEANGTKKWSKLTTATFKITDAKLYVPIVTLSIEDNSKLTKLLNEGFKRPIYWNEYK